MNGQPHTPVKVDDCDISRPSMSDQSANSAAIAALNSEVAELRTDSRNFWMIWAGVLVFSMQVSLAA